MLATVIVPATVTASVHAPDRAFVTWMMGADTRRRVTMHLQDGEGTDGSTYEFDNARLTGFNVGYSGGGGGTTTRTIVPDHLSINGFTLFESGTSLIAVAFRDAAVLHFGGHVLLVRAQALRRALPD